MDKPFFIIDNALQKRSLIHDQFGGGRYGGISPSAKHPYIFIFSGNAGHQHGYKDQWENENIFSYTGEGQLNNMQFIKGNLALRDHIKNGKRVFLFRQDIKAHVRFESELELVDIDYFIAPDREGKQRIAIKFFFKRIGKEVDYLAGHLSSSLFLGEDEAPIINMPNETERQGLITSRVGQGAYRKSILFRWNFRCAVTEYAKKEILIASHIVPWKDSKNEERLDVNNGILLSPIYDALFDRALISFENSGKIILSKALLTTRHQDIGVSGRESIKRFSVENFPYLERHRNMLI